MVLLLFNHSKPPDFPTDYFSYPMTCNWRPEQVYIFLHSPLPLSITAKHESLFVTSPGLSTCWKVLEELLSLTSLVGPQRLLHNENPLQFSCLLNSWIYLSHFGESLSSYYSENKVHLLRVPLQGDFALIHTGSHGFPNNLTITLPGAATSGVSTTVFLVQLPLIKCHDNSNRWSKEKQQGTIVGYKNFSKEVQTLSESLKILSIKENISSIYYEGLLYLSFSINDSYGSNSKDDFLFYGPMVQILIFIHHKRPLQDMRYKSLANQNNYRTILFSNLIHIFIQHHS